MATLSIPNSFTGLTTIRSADMNSNFQAIATFLNSTKLDGGNLQTSVADASTIELASSVLRVKNAGITRAKLAPVGQQISSSSSTASMALTTSFADVTNQSITITTTGRPVWVGLISDGSGPAAYLSTTTSDVTVNNAVDIKLLRGATLVARSLIQALYDVSGGSPPASWTGQLPPGVIWHIDVPAAGTYTYKLQAAKVGSGSTMTFGVGNCQLIAYEIG